MTREDMYRDFYPYAANQLCFFLSQLDAQLASGLSHSDACSCLFDYMRILLGLKTAMDQRIDALSSPEQQQRACADLLAFQAYLRTFDPLAD